MEWSKSSESNSFFTAIEALIPDVEVAEEQPAISLPSKEFDKQTFIDKMFGDIDLAREVAGLFLSHTPELMSSMREALAKRDGQKLAVIAQSLKGSIANIGAQEALRTVSELERLGQSANLAEAEKVFRKLEPGMENIRQTLAAVSGQAQRWKILIADDDPVSRRMLQAALMKWGHDPIVAADGSTALKLLIGNEEPRMAILDWMMPGLQGIEVCRELRSRPNMDYIYVILLTGRDKTDDIIEALDAGADDYMVKPFKPEELKIRVREGFRALERLAGATTEEAQEDVEQLPDLLNREAILVALKKEISRDPGTSKSVSAIMARPEALDMIRDDLGPAAAAASMREMATLARTVIGPGDAMGRYADDRLLLVLPGADRKKAEQIAGELGSKLAGAVVQSDDTTISVTACLGITTVSPSPTAYVEQVISAAESALKLAEQKGSNRFAFVWTDSGAAEPVPIRKEAPRAASRLDRELLIAARAGDFKRVRQIINSGANVNAADNNGNTPLMEAAFFRYPDVVRALLEKGADASFQNYGGDTALTEAVRAGHPEVVELLLPKITAGDVKANVALLYKALLEASTYGKTDTVRMVTSYLLTHGHIRPKKKTVANNV
jgi:diguanylate cyclase (GGDEF)-like protein